MRVTRDMRVSPAVKVAAVATAVIAAVYVISAIVLNLVVAAHLTGQNDQRLAGRLAMARQDPAAVSQRITVSGQNGDHDGDLDADSAPVFLWSVNAAGAITDHTPGAPALPATVLAGPAPRDGRTVTATLASAGPFRLELTPDGGTWLVAGQSLAGDRHTQRLLLNGEIIAGPFVLLTLFFGLLVVGLRSLAPVEQSRRRQLEFTADASHELRTPLSVIRAEADVALSASRDAAQYRDALTRIQGESERLRQLVDDMLWLARFDSRPPPPGDEPVDLVTLAQVCADRFRAVGPDVLFDRFHRATEPPSAATGHGSGAGLGLAIGDSIVRSTGGRWYVGDSSLGGALFSVSWRHSQPHRLTAPRVTAASP